MMPGSVETLTTLAFALSALTLPASSTSSSCSIANGRPHPAGYCGRELASLHQNVCSFLRTQYPSFFTRRRRAADSELGARRPKLTTASGLTLNIPLAVLARMDIPRPGGSSRFGPHEPLTPGALAPYSDLDMGSEFEDVSFPSLLHVLRKRSVRRKRDLVCDCCYNACSLERLALYC